MMHGIFLHLYTWVLIVEKKVRMQCEKLCIVLKFCMDIS